jgi:hypothetical protein
MNVTKNCEKFNESQKFYEHPLIIIDIKTSYLKKILRKMAGKELDALGITFACYLIAL